MSRTFATADSSLAPWHVWLICLHLQAWKQTKSFCPLPYKLPIKAYKLCYNICPLDKRDMESNQRDQAVAATSESDCSLMLTQQAD
jgi:hypothetical protein